MIEENTIKPNMGNTPSFLYFLLKFLIHLLEFRFLILIGTAIPSIIVVIVMLYTEDSYLSRAVIIPPSSNSGGGMSSLISDLGGDMAGLLNMDIGSKTDLDLTLEIAESESFRRKVIEEFDLFNYYEFKPGKSKIEQVIKKLNSSLGVGETDYDNLSIAFEDKSPKLCSSVVAYSYRLIDSMYLAVKNKQLIKQQKFLENKEHKTRRNLSKALDTLITFETQNKVYLPEVQMEGLVTGLVDLEKKKRVLENELEFIRRTEGTESEMFKKTKIKTQLLQQQLDSLDRGALVNDKILNSLKNTPGLIKRYQELYLEVKIQKEMLKFFIKTNEELKFKASTNYEQMELLSPGFIPTKKYAPPKSAICIVIFSIALITSILISFFIAYFRGQKETNSELYGLWRNFILKLKRFHKL